jgi:hypothetical protein
MDLRVLTPDEAAKEMYKELEELRRRIAKAMYVFADCNDPADAANDMYAALEGK